MNMNDNILPIDLPIEIILKIIEYCDGATLRTMHDAHPPWQEAIQQELYVRYIQSHNKNYMTADWDWESWYSNWLRWTNIKAIKILETDHISKMCASEKVIALTHKKSRSIDIYNIQGVHMKRVDVNQTIHNIHFIHVVNQPMPDIAIRHKKCISFLDLQSNQVYQKTQFHHIFKTFKHLYCWQLNKTLKIAQIDNDNNKPKQEKLMVTVKLCGTLMNCFLYDCNCYLDMVKKSLFNKDKFAYVIDIIFNQGDRDKKTCGEEMKRRNDTRPLMHITTDYFVLDDVATSRPTTCLRDDNLIVMFAWCIAFKPISHRYHCRGVIDLDIAQDPIYTRVPPSAIICIHENILVAGIWNKLIFYENCKEVLECDVGRDMAEIVASDMEDGPECFYMHDEQSVWKLGRD